MVQGKSNSSRNKNPDSLNQKDEEGRAIIRISVKSKQMQASLASTSEQLSEVSAEIPIEFEKHLEDFMESNLGLIEPGLKLYVDDDNNRGRQYPTDVGTIDLLCVKQNGDLIIIELKKGRGSDAVVGQISRYIGWVKENLADGKNVWGIIITHEYDDRLKYAVLANDKLRILYYKINMSFVSENELKSRESIK